MTEVWRGIEGYTRFYQVSNLGRVKSLVRQICKNQFRSENILKLRKDRYGYLKCTLCYNNKRKYKTVHRLVANAFILNLENKPQVNHVDGNKENNYINNLEWNTAKENKAHLISILRKNNKGENHSLAKLSVEDVINIKCLLAIGFSKQNEIASLFGIDVSQISGIKRNKAWRYVV